MAVTPRTAAGLAKFRPVRPGSAIALVAPASPFSRSEFADGVLELQRLGFAPVYDDTVFAREPIVAGPPQLRAEALERACTREDVDAVMAVRGGYGSVELLPLLHGPRFCERRLALIGYSDITSLHVYLNCHAGLASVHGAMIEGRLAAGHDAYDVRTLLTSLGPEPLGELAPAGVQVVRAGEAAGPIFGGTLTQLVSSLGTPFAFDPPASHVLFLDEVGERPYRIRRMLTQLRLAGILARAAAIVVGELPRCDEPTGLVTARQVIADMFADFPGPVLCGFPSGHTLTPLVSMPLGVRVRVIGTPPGRVVFEEAAAA